MAYIDAHNARLRLADDMARPMYEAYMRGMSKSMTVQRKGLPGSTAEYTSTTAEVQAALRSAETFTISAPMWALVLASATDMPNSPLLPEELPSQTGFLWLPEPMEQIDLHGRLLLTHVVVWHQIRSGGGVAVDMFTDRDDSRDEINQRLRRAENNQERLAMLSVGKYMLAHTTALPFYRPAPPSPSCQRIRDLDQTGILPEHWREHYLVYEEEFIADDGSTQVEFVPVLNEDATLTEDQFALIQDAYRGLGTDQSHLLSSYPIKQLICFWRLCQQTLAAREYVHPDRHLAKRMVKREFAKSPVTVITLRRRAQRHEEGRTVEWDHRWLRRGHWRQQWYGSGENRYQKAIYINPTICGPEDKPLLIRPHINLLAR